jgi:hypothetical protein
MFVLVYEDHLERTVTTHATYFDAKRELALLAREFAGVDLDPESEDFEERLEGDTVSFGITEQDEDLSVQAG